MPRRRRSRAPVVLLALLAVVVAAVLLADLVVVPRIADARVRERVAPYGRVQEATARSTPNLRLLVAPPERIDVRLRTVDLEALAASRTRGSGSASARRTRRTLDRLVRGGLAVRRARLRVRGGAVTVSAVAELDVVRRALSAVPGLAGDLTVRPDRLRVELQRVGLGALRTEVLAEAGRVVARTRAVVGGRSVDVGVPDQVLVDDPGFAVERLGGTRAGDLTTLRVLGALR